MDNQIDNYWKLKLENIKEVLESASYHKHIGPNHNRDFF